MTRDTGHRRLRAGVARRRMRQAARTIRLSGADAGRDENRRRQHQRRDRQSLADRTRESVADILQARSDSVGSGPAASETVDPTLCRCVRHNPYCRRCGSAPVRRGSGAGRAGRPTVERRTVFARHTGAPIHILVPPPRRRASHASHSTLSPVLRPRSGPIRSVPIRIRSMPRLPARQPCRQHIKPPARGSRLSVMARADPVACRSFGCGRHPSGHGGRFLELRVRIPTTCPVSPCESLVGGHRTAGTTCALHSDRVPPCCPCVACRRDRRIAGARMRLLVLGKPIQPC